MSDIDPQYAGRLGPRNVERLNKAPQWYRDLLESVMRDNDGLRATLAVGPENSNTVADPYSDTPRPLGQGTTIRFSPNPGDIMARFEVYLTDDGELRVTADTSLDDELVVQPWSANSLYLKFVKRRKGVRK